MNTQTPHIPRKRFGQHFLHDRNLIGRIVKAVSPKPEHCVVEIGPGEGAITFPLLEQCHRMTAIEFDRDLVEPLGARARTDGFELTVVNADVLTVDLSSLAPAGGRLRLVGNLPYNISTPILFHCLEHAERIEDMHFMLQLEVVQRMAAGHGGKEYGRLSVMLQARCKVESLFKVPPGAFRPPPKVDSAVVRLVPLRSDEMTCRDFDRLDQVVRAAFAQRRKTLHNALKSVCTDADIEAAGLRPQARAEEIPVEGFIRLSNLLSAPK